MGMPIVLRPSTVMAQAAPPAGHEDDSFDIMNLLTQHGLHDIDNETWNVYGQFTYVANNKFAFRAKYTNANGSVNSLVPGAERSFTMTFTPFFGLKLWPGGEVYFVPELIAEQALSSLRGIGGSIQNFELQKTGSVTPQFYRSRTFIRQTINLPGGERVKMDSNPMQLGTTVSSRRIVLTAGTFTVLDIFDRNNVTWDPRQTFLNMSFMTHSSWDFAADARGYSLGGAAELYWDAWALRVGRMAPPADPNELPIVVDFLRQYSDTFELEHQHTIFGQPGAARLLFYRSHEVIGRFDEAIAAYEADPVRKNAKACTGFNYGSGNATAPDLCWARRLNTKVGIGINLEQYVMKDIGLFFRGMYSDGKTEVDAFDPADRSLSFGTVAKGSAWHRPLDVTGIGFAASWISNEHARYLAMGGVDGFVGDGALTKATECVVDVFYSVNFVRAIWLTADYQHLWNPGFNADRGPVNILSGRIHAEF